MSDGNQTLPDTWDYKHKNLILPSLPKTRNASLISSSDSELFIFLVIIPRNSVKSIVPFPEWIQTKPNVTRWNLSVFYPAHHLTATEGNSWRGVRKAYVTAWNYYTPLAKVIQCGSIFPKLQNLHKLLKL